MTATSNRSFDELLAEGEAVPVEGWDFSWFDGRATEERPSWGYARLAADRVATTHPDSVLDLQTGGGEVFAEILAAAAAPAPARTSTPANTYPLPSSESATFGHLPRAVWATEGWPPNRDLAREHLELFRGDVVLVAPDERLPFDHDRFDLVLSRHPAFNDWPEIARVLRPGGSYLSQQVGAGSNRELYEFLMGAHPVGENDDRSPAKLVEGARNAGLKVVELVHEETAVEFFDVAAVVYFLRKVLWTVPDFTVDRYRERLAALHAHIEAEGSFGCHSRRVLMEARKPAA